MFESLERLPSICFTVVQLFCIGQMRTLSVADPPTSLEDVSFCQGNKLLQPAL